MSEQITVTVSLEQAEALVDAATCLSLAADGVIGDLVEVYTPDGTPDSRDADRYRIDVADRAMQGAEVLRTEIAGVNKRDPDLQEMLHALKMYRKHGGPR